MKNVPYLTDRERAAVQALLVDQMVARCRKSESDLDDLLRSGLQLPEVAVPPVKANALRDDDELRRLVARYVTGLLDLPLLEALKRSDPDLRSLERLGFDPFRADRAAAYASARRVINVRQAVAATVVGMVLVLMTLIPPWEERIQEKRTHFLFLPQKTTTLEERSAGYAFLFDPPRSQTLEHGKNDQALYGDRWVVREYGLDLTRLGQQYVATMAAAALLVYLLRTRAYRPERFAPGLSK